MEVKIYVQTENGTHPADMTDIYKVFYGKGTKQYYRWYYPRVAKKLKKLYELDNKNNFINND